MKKKIVSMLMCLDITVVVLSILITFYAIRN